jgi:hypothetical protein
LTALVLLVPSAARADSITATCTSGGVTTPCDGRWFRANVTVSFTLPAGSSNPQGCGDQPITSDTNGFPIRCSVSVSGTQCCVLDVMIKRDATPPSVDSVAAARAPDANGWYNHAVAVTAAGSDGTSGIASCTSTTYSGPDTGSASVPATCTDNAGNVSAAKTLALQYDATAPTVTASPARGPDANGWYNHPVAVSFSGSDGASGVESCSSGSYSGPDAGSASVSGTCKDKAGNTGSASFGLQYDSTPPAVSGAAADRAPDKNGWYNHALTVSYSGTDGGSGIASCDKVAYSKPDDPSAKVTGTCHDNAGNVSAPAPFAFKFDDTPPKLGNVTTSSSSTAVVLNWTASTDVAQLKVQRLRSGASPVQLYDGKRIVTYDDKKVQNGGRYTYVITALDQAGNAATSKSTGTPANALISPRQSAQVRGGATLRWRGTKNASYYNVQLWSHGKKVLTTWPAHTSLRLPKLRPGTYLWLVWPGVGARSAHKYGPLIGKSSFVVKG